MDNKKAMLHRIKEIYSHGGNIIQYLRKESDERQNSLEDILISYDFQAGSYTEMMEKNTAGAVVMRNRAQYFSDVLRKLPLEKYSIMEAGTGECSFLREIYPEIQGQEIYAFDISWSRVKYARKYMSEKLENGGVNLFVGDMFSIPMADDSIDVVFTSQSMEPNGGHERELLKELYRVTRKYLILQEPAYELASETAQERMRMHGYVRGLLQAARELSMDVVEYKLFPEDCYLPYTPVALMIIRKDVKTSERESKFACPVTHTELIDYGDALFSNESLLAYPKLDRIPLLTEANAVVATKFLER